MSAEEPKRRRIEIVHESLLTKWPRLVHWQTQDAEGAQFRDELRQATHLWEQHDRSQDFLWTGTAYREFQLWRERYPGNLTEIEEEFAQAIAAHAQRRRRRRQMAVAFVVVLAVVIGVATTFLWRRSEGSRHRAEMEARRATAAKLLALGQLQLDSYPTAALAYATKSLELADSVEARHFAVKALWRGPVAFILSLPGRPWYQLQFSPDAKWLATSSVEDTVLVFPSSGRRPIVLGGHEATGSPRHAEFAPQSDLLITKTVGDDPVRIWAIPEGKLVRRIGVEGQSSFARRVNEGPPPFVQRAGRIWMFNRTPNTRSDVLRRWSLPDSTAVDVGHVDLTDVADIDIDPTGTSLVLARGREVFLRSLEFLNRGTEQLVGTNSEKVTKVVFGANRELLSRDTTGEIRVWSVEGKKPRVLRVIRGSASERSPRFDPTAARVAVADPTERVIRVWKIAAAPEIEPLQLRRADAERIEQLDFATRGGQWLAADNFTSVSFWPLTSEYSRVFRGHTNAVRRLRFGPNGSWITSASLDGTVRVWPVDERSGSRSRVLLKAPVFIYGLAVDPLGEKILIGVTDKRALLATPDGQEPVPLEMGAPSVASQAAAFDRRGLRAALGANYSPSPKGRIIRIWDVATGKVLRELDLLQGRHGNVSGPYDGGVWDIEFAPDGSLYSAGIGGVRRWDIENGASTLVVAGDFMLMDLGDDGRHLLTVTRRSITGPDSSVVRYHDLATRISRTLASHGSDVGAVALDPTGTIAVTASYDGTIRVGRVTGEEPHLLFGHGGVVNSVAVSSDGHWIASGGGDGTVRVWPMPDLSKPPLHTLPHDKLLAKLRSLTNLRVIEDANSPNGYKLDVGPFPGWEAAPEW